MQKKPQVLVDAIGNSRCTETSSSPKVAALLAVMVMLRCAMLRLRARMHTRTTRTHTSAPRHSYVNTLCQHLPASIVAYLATEQLITCPVFASAVAARINMGVLPARGSVMRKKGGMQR